MTPQYLLTQIFNLDWGHKNGSENLYLDNLEKKDANSRTLPKDVGPRSQTVGATRVRSGEQN